MDSARDLCIWCSPILVFFVIEMSILAVLQPTWLPDVSLLPVTPTRVRSYTPLVSEFSGMIVHEEKVARIQPGSPLVSISDRHTTPKVISRPICGGCFLQEISSRADGITCGQWMHQQGKGVIQAGKDVAKEFPDSCARCDPSKCSDNDKRYWSLDAAAPIITAARSPRLSLPEKFRLPEHTFGHFDGWFSDTNNRHSYVFEWNPTIVVLPEDQIPDRHLENTLEDQPVYLAAFRVSKQQNCFRNTKEWLSFLGHDSPSFKEGFVDLLGMALLRADYSIIEQGHFDFRRVSKRNQDIRLFAFEANDGSGESRIYMSAFHETTRIWLRPPVNHQETKLIFFDHFEMKENPFVVFVEDRTSCCYGCRGGKNFQYFKNDEGIIKVETLPLAPHIVEDIDFDSSCVANEYSLDASVVTAQYKDTHVPDASFYNTLELDFMESKIYNPPYDKNMYGTACCVRIPDPHNAGKTLLMGISHTKTKITKEEIKRLREANLSLEPRQYHSQIYAFEGTAPYRVVARSGSFCLPFPSEEESSENYYVKLLSSRPYVVGKPLACPFITFPISLIEKHNDPDTLILTYGINDCTSRIVEMPKKDLELMLFEPWKRQS